MQVKDKNDPFELMEHMITMAVAAAKRVCPSFDDFDAAFALTTAAKEYLTEGLDSREKENDEGQDV